MDDVARKEIEDRLIEFYNVYCTDQINEMYVAYPQKRAIAVSMKDLAEFDGELTSELMNNPDMILPNANSALARLNPTRPLIFWKGAEPKPKSKKKGAPAPNFSEGLGWEGRRCR